MAGASKANLINLVMYRKCLLLPEGSRGEGMYTSLVDRHTIYCFELKRDDAVRFLLRATEPLETDGSDP